MQNIDRLHYMDSLRATAMFLGLVFHGAVVFGEWTVDFLRHHDESSLFVRYFPEVIHVFRMQLFFLVAGYFSIMLCEKRGIINYAKNRFIRIFIPFAFCVLLIQPWLAGHFLLDITGSKGSIFSQYIKYMLDPSYIFQEAAMTGNWFWHFWFLHLLIYFIGAFLVSRIIINKLRIKIRFVPSLIKLVGGKFGMLFLAVLTYPTLLISAPFSEVPTIGTSLEILCYYGIFFFFGLLFFKNVEVFDQFQSNIKYHVLPLIISLFFLFPLMDEFRLKAQPELLLQNLCLYTGVESQSSLIGSYPFIQNPFNLSGITAPLDWHLMCFLRAYTTWCSIVLLIVFFKKYFSKQSALGRYAADSSYFIYLIHFPIQLSIAYFVRDHISSAIACFWLCVGMTTIICILLYHFTCRGTPIGILLSGRKYSLSISNEWNDLKLIFGKKSFYIGLLLIAFTSVVAGSIETRKEKKLLYYSNHAEPRNIEDYISNKTSDELKAIKRSDGRNPLHMATYNLSKPRPDEKIAESIQLLLNAGLDPTSVDDFGQTPLHYAVRNGNKIALSMLLKAGANPNAADAEYGNTPLHYAATLGNDDIIQKLIAAGGDPKLPRKNGENSLVIFKKFHSKPFPKK
jgi:glucan biosynthesis protein C